jgi:NADPH-dependent 2,4-dienoyl-CoA reductase/sulfur reductase-like enzyme
MGREFDLGDGIDFPQVERKRKVMVVGAGPGGMEAARVAALRGHDVTLYDKEQSMGGLLPLATFIKGSDFDDLAPAYQWYERQLKKSDNLTLALGTEVTPELVDAVKPDVIILSPGNNSVLPEIPGIDSSIVVSTGQLQDTAKSYLKYLNAGMMSKLSKIYMPVGKRVVIVGGDLKGLEAAEFLAKRGKQVVIVENSEQLGRGMNLWIQFKFFPWMEANPNITAHVGATVHQITEKGMVIATAEGEKKTLEADTVMVMELDRKNHGLYETIKKKGIEVHLVGDAKEDENAWLEGTISDAVGIGMTI